METTAAYGHNYNPWSAEFTISKQNDTAHYLGVNADKNQPWGNKLILHKTDSETGNEIASDAVFSLYEWNAQRGLYEISTNYAIVRDADGSYTVKCLHSDWTQAQYGSLYFEDTLCDVRGDTSHHDGTASTHPVYYTDYGMDNYPNSRAFTKNYLIHLTPRERQVIACLYFLRLTPLETAVRLHTREKIICRCMGEQIRSMQ